MNFSVGIGQDSHKFESEEVKGLTLGGVYLPEETRLRANSDGDVVLHALFNAISSAMGEGSISLTADKMCAEGILDSREYLRVLLEKMREKGFEVNNVSISLEGKRPRIEPIAGKMKEALAEIMGIPADTIGITATSGEGLSAFGRGEGIQCIVVTSLLKK